MSTKGTLKTVALKNKSKYYVIKGAWGFLLGERIVKNP